MTAAGPDSLFAALPAALRPQLASCEVVDAIESTNAALLVAPPPPAGQMRVLLAREQTAGRGRRGRRWLAPRDAALCVSVAWLFGSIPRDVAALSLATGVCALRALRACGVAGVALKWPNDLVAGDSKLGGILIETRTEAHGALLAVIGLGVNLALAEDVRAAVQDTGTVAIDCKQLAATPPTAIELASAFVRELLPALPRFAEQGLQPFRSDWDCADALRDRAVSVLVADREVQGIARGIEANGAFRVDTVAGPQRFFVGEVSVRAAGA